MKIHALSEEIIKRIAAGEVVERPASVVKELIENSLDAKAQRIDVEIKGAGRLLIQVTDDGIGMDRNDLAVCVHRHTTSKIQTIEDVDRITSLGFRGEALYSIAAVSKFDMVSRTADDPIAHCLTARGGEIQEIIEIGAPVGTRVEVKELFWNTPARLKFLKSPATETRHIFETVALYALTRPEVAFRLRDGEKTLMDVQNAQQFLERIQNLYNGLGKDWIDVDYESQSIKVKGYVGHPQMARADRTFQFFFVNQRPVRSPAMAYALEAAYHSLLPDRRHPISFLFIELDPETIDVNIHPAKKEIRFHRAQWVQEQLREAIRRALSVSFTSRTQLKETYQDRVMDSVEAYFESQRSTPGSQNNLKKDYFQKHEKKELQQFIGSVKLGESSFLVLERLGDLYWVVKFHDHFAFIDQHAAHERVLYERFLKAWKAHQVQVQKLLIPVTMELSEEDCSLIRENEEVLKNLGFEMEGFGDHTVIVHQVPAYTHIHQLKEFILDIIDDLKTLRKTVHQSEARLEEKIILRSCKSAVKAHDPMTEEEMGQLVADLLNCELPFTCPHGRPTMIKFTSNDLAKMFKRQ